MFQGLDEADTNHDGVIQLEELVEFVLQLVQDAKAEEAFSMKVEKPTIAMPEPPPFEIAPDVEPATICVPVATDIPAAELDAYLRELFEIGDENQDGVLQPDEAIKLLSLSGLHFPAGMQIEELVARADLNGDGVIDYQEFVPLARSFIQGAELMGSGILNNPHQQSGRVSDSKAVKSGKSRWTDEETEQILSNLPPVGTYSPEAKAAAQEFDATHARESAASLQPPEPEEAPAAADQSTDTAVTSLSKITQTEWLELFGSVIGFDAYMQSELFDPEEFRTAHVKSLEQVIAIEPVTQPDVADLIYEGSRWMGGYTGAAKPKSPVQSGYEQINILNVAPGAKAPVRAAAPPVQIPCARSTGTVGRSKSWLSRPRSLFQETRLDNSTKDLRVRASWRLGR